MLSIKTKYFYNIIHNKRGKSIVISYQMDKIYCKPYLLNKKNISLINRIRAFLIPTNL